MKQARTSTVSRVIRLLEAFATADGPVGVREISRRTGIDKSAVSRILAQLHEAGVLARDEVAGAYSIGPHWFAISAALVASDRLSRAALPILEELRDQLNETCYLAERSKKGVTFQLRAECERSLRYVIELGSENPIHAGAAGRAVLFGMSPQERQEVLADATLERIGKNTITDRNRLLEVLVADAARGFSLSRAERSLDGSGFAAPYFGASGRCEGSVVLTRPLARHSDGDIGTIGPAVAEAASLLSRRLGFLDQGFSEAT